MAVSVGDRLEDLVPQQFGIVGVVRQELLHVLVGKGTVVPPEDGGDPLLGEEDVAGALDLLEDVQGGTDVAEGFGLTERVVEVAERGLHPGLVAAVLRQQEGGFVTLLENAQQLVLQGVTTSDEILRVINEET